MAGLVNDPAKYKWSSYLDYITQTHGSIITGQDIILGQFKNKSDYKGFVESSYKIIKEKKDLEEYLLDI